MAALLAGALAASCGLTPPSLGDRRPPYVPFTATLSESDHATFLAAGTASITGQAFLRQRGGGVVTCAGSTVLLLPDTPYFDALLQHVHAGNALSMIDGGTAAVQRYGRAARCDSRGEFALHNLPAADWILSARVTWTAAGAEQGGWMRRLVRTQAGSAERALLTDEDRSGRP